MNSGRIIYIDMNDIKSKYDPSNVEDKWYQYWLKHKLFASKPDERESYTIVMPPPNVTGVLHMGHMLNNTIQDILIRRARLDGKNALWVPGTDHASIATEAKVVNKLAEEGIKKCDLSREAFLEHAWEWTHKHGGIIIDQLKKLGASCDWDRTAFTMDDRRSDSVIDVFIDLYKKGLIYRGVRMVNWDPKALTALSDEEVNYVEEHSKLYYLKYHLVDYPKGYIVIATTRPETILGDTAVCINPNDERYHHLKGKKVVVPIVGREIPIIEDEYVEIEFGTGCLKVTPAHDVNDYMLGQKHHLESIDIFNDNGTLNHNGLQYANMDRFEVRTKIARDLESLNLMEKIEDYTNKVGRSERTDVPIEPKLSMQWFLDMKKLVKPAINAVTQDEVKLIPPKFKNVYFHWMNNIKDWCISRQLWWGHRIPAFYLPGSNEFIVAKNVQDALKIVQEKTGNMRLTENDLRQDPDCLDTWFSSWLWPMSVFAGVLNPTPQELEELDYYYPTSTLVTGPDILFFWVARMIMAGYEYRHKRPFSNVYLTGIVRDAQGRKMSKSLGNSPDPLVLIDKYGADGVRMGLMTSASAGNDILFDEALCEQGRNFNNKIWNSFRLISGWSVDEDAIPSTVEIVANKWFDNRIREVSLELEDCFSKFRISEAMLILYKLFWDDFSACYLELVKPNYGQKIAVDTKKQTVAYFEQLMLLLHPFMPFITEEIWQQLADRQEGDSIMKQVYVVTRNMDKGILAEVLEAREIVGNVRNIRAKHNISPKEPLSLIDKQGVIKTNAKAVISKLANVEIEKNSNVQDDSELSTFMVGTESFAVPMTGFIDKAEELKKLKGEQAYFEKFLKSVEKKLENEKFVNNAPEQVVALERKKKADATEKLVSIKQRLDALSKV